MMEFPTVKIYYIHGFRSSPDSDTVRRLRAHFPELIGLTYDHEDPAGSIERLVRKIGFEDEAVIVGSSLGGWYAEKVAESVLADLVLFNPALSPEVTLARYAVPEAVLKAYADLRVADAVPVRRRAVFLADDDDVIDPAEARSRYAGRAEIHEILGGHRLGDVHVSAVAEAINKLVHSLV